MDSDDSNISDHVGDLDIQPYQFEPLCNDESQQEREHSTSSAVSHVWSRSDYSPPITRISTDREILVVMNA
jgi:hypothetical protein